jgi:hypothetical protein
MMMVRLESYSSESIHAAIVLDEFGENTLYSAYSYHFYMRSTSTLLPIVHIDDQLIYKIKTA